MEGPFYSAEISVYFFSHVSSVYIKGSTPANCGPGSSVGIVTEYGLDSPGSNAGGDKIFCPFRLALGPTHSPVQWVLGLSQG